MFKCFPEEEVMGTFARKADCNEEALVCENVCL